MKENFIYGIKVVPRFGENGVAYDGFQGIVIDILYPISQVSIYKMINKEDGYYVDNYVKIPFKDLFTYSESGKMGSDFLISETQNHFGEDVPIAFTSNMRDFFLLLDQAVDRSEKTLIKSLNHD